MTDYITTFKHRLGSHFGIYVEAFYLEFFPQLKVQYLIARPVGLVEGLALTL